MDFRQKNNRLQLGTVIRLLGFVCWTSCLLVGVIVNRRRSMTLKKEGIVSGCETRAKLNRPSEPDETAASQLAVWLCCALFSEISTDKRAGVDRTDQL